MQKHIGYIGLGKMGKNMAMRLAERGWAITATDASAEVVAGIDTKNITGVLSVADVAAALPAPRIIWIMVPHKVVDDVLAQLTSHLAVGDIVIDGGNSFYKDSVRRGQTLSEKGIHFVDAGTSGGPGGAHEGACVMVGGEKDIVDSLTDLFIDIAAPDAYQHVGRIGAGHFVKMVHNGIEYGMMQAIGEGFEVLKRSDFDLDLTQVANLYNHRSVIESRLVGWIENAFKTHGADLHDISGSATHSGEGLWTVETAKELGVQVPIIEGSLNFRDESLKKPSFTAQVVNALRNQFGGHDVAKK